MKDHARRLVRLMLGLTVMSFGIAMSYQTALGLAPWDVLHDGLSQLLPMTMGEASVVLGIVVLAADAVLREKLGLGTIINAVAVGLIYDAVQYFKIIPSFAHCEGLEQLAPRLVMCVAAMVLQAAGLYLYMSAGLGGGPRDSFMCALARRAKRMGVGGVRLITEGVVFAAGWLLGGTVGLGSIVLVIGSGPIMELIFRACKFDIKTFTHKSVADSVREMKKQKTPL